MANVLDPYNQGALGYINPDTGDPWTHKPVGNYAKNLSKALEYREFRLR